MAADAWDVYNDAKEMIINGTMDLDADVLKVALYNSTEAPAATDTAYSTTNELATQYGYTQGGWTVTGAAVSESSGTITFDMNDPNWTASGGSITARYAILYNDTTTPKQRIACCLLDNTPADVTVTDTNTLTVQIHANGVFQVTGGWT